LNPRIGWYRPLDAAMILLDRKQFKESIRISGGVGIGRGRLSRRGVNTQRS
jgi:hypothetical protein